MCAKSGIKLISFSKKFFVYQSPFNASTFSVSPSNINRISAVKLSFLPRRFFATVAITENSSEFAKASRKRRHIYSSYEEIPYNQRIICLPLADSIDIRSVLNDRQIANVYVHRFIDSKKGVYFAPKPQYILNKKFVREFFVLGNGVMAFWGMEDAEREHILQHIRRHLIAPHDPKLVEDETDFMQFTMVQKSASKIVDESLLLNDEDGIFSESSILKRYAFSQGFGASVKIAVWESQFRQRAEPLDDVTRALCRGVIQWDRRQALVMQGKFSTLRYSVNIGCVLLDTDFYWENEELEQYFELSQRHFMLPQRLKELNNQLNYCEDLVKVIEGMLAHRHASRLEWMIIILIVVEVIFDIMDYLEKTKKN